MKLLKYLVLALSLLVYSTPVMGQGQVKRPTANSKPGTTGLNKPNKTSQSKYRIEFPELVCGLHRVAVGEKDYWGTHKTNFYNNEGQLILSFEDGLFGHDKDYIWSSSDDQFVLYGYQGVPIFKLNFGVRNVSVNFKGFVDGLAVVERKTKEYGVIDLRGNIIVPFCAYDNIHNLGQGFVSVRKDNKWGIINSLGQQIVPLKYDDISPFSEGLSKVELNDRTGFIDTEGNEVISVPGSTGFFRNGIACVVQNGKKGYIDKKGNVIIPIIYNNVMGLYDGLIGCYNSSNKFGYINIKGETIIPFHYGFGKNFGEGLAAVRKDGKCGVIDKNNNIVIPFIYDDIYPFEDGLACVKINRKYGLINKSGQLVVPCKYAAPISFDGDIAIVRCPDSCNYGLINKSGEEIAPPIYGNLFKSEDGLMSACIGDQNGYLDKQGVFTPTTKYRHK